MRGGLESLALLGAVDPLTSPPDVFDLVPMFFVTEFS